MTAARIDEARPPIFQLLGWGTVVCALGCQASVQSKVEVEVSSGAAKVHDFDKPLEAPPVELKSETAEFSLTEFALLGARHDLQYSGPTDASCRCLAVSLQDQAEHSTFQWDASAPRLEPTTQSVIALSSADVDCKRAPKDTLGASYQGYEVSGNDVIVLVEPLSGGRPLTHGAVIPKPLGDGNVFIQASGKVYGKPLSGRGKRCKITSASSPNGVTASR